MGIPAKLVGSIAAAAIVITSAAPAAARGWGPPRHYWHEHHDSDAGAVIGAIAAVGIIAAIASAASAKKKQAVEQRDEDQASYRGSGYQGQDYADRGYDRPSYEGRPSTYVSQDEAVDACALAARDEGTRISGFAEVRDITGVSPIGTGWDITGRIEQRASYRANDGHVRGFRCAYQEGQVSALSLD